MNQVAPDTGNVATFPIADLVLDPALQCRTKIDDETVEIYAAAIDAGTVFPPITVMRVGDGWYVVDGWHRVRAAKKAGRDDVQATIVRGTRRDAMLAAVAANADHGLPRSRADRRRAVVVLLQDEQCSAMSGHELAALAKVSHTHVNNVRRDYGIRRGELLTEEHRARVDGDLTAAWKQIMERGSGWEREGLEAIRVAGDPRTLIEARRQLNGTTACVAAFDLRRDELADQPWPWPEDVTDQDIAAHFGRLESIDELVAAARARTPHVDEVYRVLKFILNIPRMSIYEIERHDPSIPASPAFGRPTIRAALDARAAKLKAAAAGSMDDWDRARIIEKISDASEQALAIEAATDSVNFRIGPSKLHPSVRDTVWRGRVAPGQVVTCQVPGCTGWVRPETTYNRSSCVLCREAPDEWKRNARVSMTQAGQLLRVPGYGVIVDDVLIDSAAITLLKQIRSGSGELAEARAAWLASSAHVLLVDPAAEAAAAEAERLAVIARANAEAAAGELARASASVDDVDEDDVDEDDVDEDDVDEDEDLDDDDLVEDDVDEDDIDEDEDLDDDEDDLDDEDA